MTMLIMLVGLCVVGFSVSIGVCSCYELCFLFCYCSRLGVLQSLLICCVICLVAALCVELFWLVVCVCCC